MTAEQKIIRTSGNIERFIVKHQVGVSQSVTSLKDDLYIVRTWAETGNRSRDLEVSAAEIRMVHTVSGDAINNELLLQRENVGRDLVGRWNLAIDLQREQEARDAFKETFDDYERYQRDHEQVDENGEVIA